MSFSLKIVAFNSWMTPQTVLGRLPQKTVQSSHTLYVASSPTGLLSKHQPPSPMHPICTGQLRLAYLIKLCHTQVLHNKVLHLSNSSHPQNVYFRLIEFPPKKPFWLSSESFSIHFLTLQPKKYKKKTKITII